MLGYNCSKGRNGQSGELFMKIKVFSSVLNKRVLSSLFLYGYSVLKTAEQSESKASLYFRHCFKFSTGRVWFSGVMSYARVRTEMSAQA